ncbi:MAG: hypothetical protein H7Y38_06150 [Armatimonadetes bacterium]|nr:hypothetical protein [Armatimonadota bacterium]
MSSEEGESGEKNDSLPEKVTFWTSLLLVVSLFGFLGYAYIAELRSGAAGKAPEATATVALQDAKRMDDSHWTTPVSIRNTGRVPLEEVQIEITYKSASGAKKSKEVAFAYLAAGSAQSVYIVTDLPPDRANLSATVTYLKTQQKARGY